MQKTARNYLVGLLMAFITGVCHGGHLQLNPNLPEVTRLAGQDTSFFISCLPQSSHVGPVGDSRVRAKELAWKRLPDVPKGHGDWVVIGSQTHARIHVEQSADGRGLDLVFRSIEIGDSGTYSCSAELDGEKISQQFHLNVVDPISFSEENLQQSVEEGTASFTLRCDVSGTPQPKVTWNVRGQIVHGGTGKYEATSEGLVIRNVTKDDQGTYKCKAIQMSEGITDFKDLLITLKVEHGPELPPEQRGQFYGYISGMANLTCLAKAEPPAKFQWLNKNGIELEPKGSSTIILNSEHKSVLRVQVTHDDDFGDYTCIAKNKMGNLRKVVTLSEGAKPGVPTINIHRIGHDFVELSILENRAELFLEIVGFQIEVQEKSKTEEWSNATVLDFPKNASNKYIVSQLQPKSVYMIRSRAKNLAGFSDPSNMIVLQTKSPHMVGELTGNASAVMSILAMPWTTYFSVAVMVPIWGSRLTIRS